MSLSKQLWMAIAIVTFLAFGASFVISTYSARNYLQDQLSIKNNDNAASLALSMSQLPKDNVFADVQVSTLFDTGYYRSIRLLGPDGKTVIAEREDNDRPAVPGWLTKFVEIRPQPGTALIQNGWSQYGVLKIESSENFAYISLWEGTIRLFWSFFIGAILTGLLGSFLLRRAINPLEEVIHQAESIGDRQFITIPVPKTKEFKQVVEAMNKLSLRIQSMLEVESGRVDELRMEAQFDPVTGILNRDNFIAHLRASLDDQDEASEGVLMLIRADSLITINRQVGRETADLYLQRITKGILAATQNSTAQVGRLNGSDFCLYLLGSNNEGFDQNVYKSVHDAVGTIIPEELKILPMGTVSFSRSDGLPQIMAHADLALNRSINEAHCELVSTSVNEKIKRITSLEHWRSIIEQSIDTGRIALGSFPVIGRKGEVLHYESPVRLRTSADSGELIAAGDFVPWATRAQLLERIDLKVMTLAFDALARDSMKNICINFSAEIVSNQHFWPEIDALVRSHGDSAKRLWIDVPEQVAFMQPNEFRRLANTLKPLGIKIGLKHVGQYVCRIGEIHDVGLDHIKINRAVVRDIDKSTGNQTFLRALVTVSHTLGAIVIAEGVENQEESDILEKLGFDGQTGTFIRTT